MFDENADDFHEYSSAIAESMANPFVFSMLEILVESLVRQGLATIDDDETTIELGEYQKPLFFGGVATYPYVTLKLEKPDMFGNIDISFFCLSQADSFTLRKTPQGEIQFFSVC